MVLLKAFNGILSAERSVCVCVCVCARARACVCEGTILNNFKFPSVIRYILNVWIKIIKDLNVHVMYWPLVYSETGYGAIKIIKLSCTLSMVLWIQSKKIYIFFNYKKCKCKNIWNKKGTFSNLLNRLLHDTLLLWPIIILIIYFCILKIFMLCVEFPQKGKP
jgi:hypothetical protein